ncbi:cytochrome c oxidase assembly protein [Kineococcus rubinsiae]|uniref:cytochrome c oxidase assembly protein n=1 Tax=Kineococcus rubinsiae TaxID=2609562 RepID=UPI0014306508|nr:cytochrome c oxidase assembly protein [Kineococcus rubinsiae]NIZ89543.1 cytochrome c oxidase assembly protein [Kineococcus rubinsiae]
MTDHHGSTPGALAGAAPLGASFGMVLLTLLLAAAATAPYLAASARLRGRGDRWPAGRALLWSAAALCVPAAVAAGDLLRERELVAHVAQHVLLGMVLPVAAALAAPLSLALRVLPPRPRGTLLALLRSRWARVVTSAPAVVLLEVSGFVAFFLTPLHHAVAGRPVLAVAVHAHAVLAGYLFASLLVGRDPLRGRPGVRGRLLVLLLVAGAHDTVARLLVASAPADAGVRAAGELLAGAGTVVDVGLAALVMAGWYAAGHLRPAARPPARRRRPSRPARRSGRRSPRPAAPPRPGSR